MPVRVGINGFGRIGRNVMRAARASDSSLEFVALNDLTDCATLAHLLRHDSVHGRYPGEVESNGETMRVDGRELRVFSHERPADIPWGEAGVDVVIESTGVLKKREQASGHLEAGARRVVISAPSDGADVTICMGINEGDYDPGSHRLVSNASCTTNCLAPVAKVLHETFGIEKAWMTTVHSYTNNQRILDLPHKDLRRGRAAAMSMIPTSTGAARALGLVLPELAGKVDGCAVRVPTPNVSLIDLIASVGRSATVEEINEAFRSAAAGALAGVLAVSDEPLVSVDYTGSRMSATVDAEFTRVVEDDLVQVIAWYDNEMGYSARVVDLVTYIGERLP